MLFFTLQVTEDFIKKYLLEKVGKKGGGGGERGQEDMQDGQKEGEDNYEPDFGAGSMVCEKRSG